MNHLLEVLLGRTKMILAIFVLLLIAGVFSYQAMPKESNPDIAIPIIYVTLPYPGISPEDGERLLIRPMEQELRSIEGIKSLTSRAVEGMSSVTMEFYAGINKDKALQKVREKVDLAKANLPVDAKEPVIHEVNFSLFPVLVVALSGEIPERTLLNLSKSLSKAIESISSVLEVDIAGGREDAVEIIVNPATFERYNLKFEEILPLFRFNNQLVTGGNIDTGVGRIPVKVPGVFEDPVDIFQMPVKVTEDKVVRLQDVAYILKGYKDRRGFSRCGGKPAVALEVKKRAGENAIRTIQQIREVVAQVSSTWPDGVKVDFFQDQSLKIESRLHDLINTLITAVLLVMAVIVVSLGVNSAILVGIAIPGSFLAGLFVLNMMGITINIVVLFALILAVGMLVDGAIIVVEFADRKMIEGYDRRKAYLLASQRMALPVLTSTLATIAAFVPLLFWPDVVGEFMKFLPITLVTTLTASLVMALIFVPVLGGIFGKPGEGSPEVYKHLAVSETGNIDELKGFTGFYIRLLEKALKHPAKVFLSSCLVLFAVYATYIEFGNGVEFFPKVEPERFLIHMKARGNLSVTEIDNILKQVENRILDMPELATIYSKSGFDIMGQDITEDTRGEILIEFSDWKTRRPAKVIMQEVEGRIADIAGVVLEVREEQSGPSAGKPVNLEISSMYPEVLDSAAKRVYEKMKSMHELRNVSDTRSIPEFEWRVVVDRTEASRYGANITAAGNMLQFVTSGLKIAEYRPFDSDDEVDIIVRYPQEFRNLNELKKLHVPTAYGSIPLANFASFKAAQRVGTINRANLSRTINVAADVEPGALPSAIVEKLDKWLKTEAKLDPRINILFKGEDEDQKRAAAFLQKAFLLAIAVIGIILIAEFNSFYDTLLILSAIIFSTGGVFFGLLVTQQPFCIIMNGIGIVALAGIVVNHNIVLIDTYNLLRAEKMPVLEAILRTCAQRLRPVILTSVTTILGLLPMVFSFDFDYMSRELVVGSPSAQWWTQLSTSIVVGLLFAKFITLFLTPALLLLGDQMFTKLRRWGLMAHPHTDM